MARIIEVTNGTLELVPTPGHVNLIAMDGAETCELRLEPDELSVLLTGMKNDDGVTVDTESGLVSWEPQRGLYFEEYSGGSFYLVCSPEDREDVIAGLTSAQPL